MPDVRVAILGVGNVLEADDGAGVWAVRDLEAAGLPEGARAYDMGTALLDLPSELDGCERLVVVDAVRSGGTPGAVWRVEFDALEEAEAEPVSLHQVGARRMLAMARLSGLRLGPAALVAVEAAEIRLHEGLSGPVRRAMPRLLAAVRDEVEAALARAPEEVVA
ncbi:MAG: hydrogenase maturation protease [Deltaproteobacteria bacterium]|nr:hydrogenase maturation protease [Deltaproteobacteria bacterium]